jgi:hypothetical protein
LALATLVPRGKSILLRHPPKSAIVWVRMFGCDRRVGGAGHGPAGWCRRCSRGRTDHTAKSRSRGVQKWPNTGQIPVKHWSSTGTTPLSTVDFGRRRLTRGCRQILVKYWSNQLTRWCAAAAAAAVRARTRGAGRTRHRSCHKSYKASLTQSSLIQDKASLAWPS